MDSYEHVSELDSWRIKRLREQPRASRLDRLLLDEGGGATRIGELEARVLELEARLAAQAPAGHLLFRPTPHGYALVEVDGPPPELDQPLVVDGRRYAVQRTGRSPFPADRRPCLFLVES